MRRVLGTLIVLVLVAAACGDDAATTTAAPSDTTPTTTAPSGSTTTAATTTATTTVAPAVTTETETVDPTAALDVCDRVLQAELEGDVAGWKDCFAEDAVFLMIGGGQQEMWTQAPWGGDDFDGDGIASLGDGMMVDVALGPPSGNTMDWSCTPLDGLIECTVTSSNGFERAAGLEEGAITIQYSVAGDEIVEWEVLAAQTLQDHEGTMDKLFAEWAAYQQWVLDNYPEDYDVMFDGTCCDAMRVGTPESVALHAELTPEYLATLEG